MLLWCHRRHWIGFGGGVSLYQQPKRHTPGQFVLCCVAQSEALVKALILAGFLCADTDGGLLYWRLRFWRPSFHRRWIWRALLEEIKA